MGDLQGSLVQYATVDAWLLALKPKSLSMREAAALPLVAITAREGLVDRAGVRPWQRVLVHRGAGGVGSAAVQIARAHGAGAHPVVVDGAMLYGDDSRPPERTRPAWSQKAIMGKFPPRQHRGGAT